MLKTGAIKQDQLELALELEASVTTPNDMHGMYPSTLTDDKNTSVITNLSLQQKSPEDKPRQSFTGNSLVFSWQRFADIVQEIVPLWKKHWEEIALHQDKIALDPDFERYYGLELQSILHVLTVRDGGRLVGYAFVMVTPHLHYASTSWALYDMFWLDPDYRFGWDGIRLFREVERRMRDLGVKVLAVPYKVHFQADRGRLDRIFKRLGYSPTEIVVSKYIG